MSAGALRFRFSPYAFHAYASAEGYAIFFADALLPLFRHVIAGFRHADTIIIIVMP
jgi:hypothetical protein